MAATLDGKPRIIRGLIRIAAVIYYSGRGLPIHPDHGRDLDGKPRIDSNSRGYYYSGRGFIRIMAAA